MAKQQNNGQEQDVNQLRKVRRDKLAELQAEWKRSVQDHKIRSDTSLTGSEESV